MSASLKRVRKNMKVTETDLSYTLTMKVRVYKNTKIIEAEGTPINHDPDYNQAEGWLGVHEVIAIELREFARMTGAK